MRLHRRQLARPPARAPLASTNPAKIVGKLLSGLLCYIALRVLDPPESYTLLTRFRLPA